LVGEVEKRSAPVLRMRLNIYLSNTLSTVYLVFPKAVHGVKVVLWATRENVCSCLHLDVLGLAVSV
jgi:hypothetical protein